MQVFAPFSSSDRLLYGSLLRNGAAELSLSLDEKQLRQLLDYLSIICKWNAIYNLTAVRDPAQMVTQHLLDSLSVASAYAGASRVLDVGAGAGLPGIVLAIWASRAVPTMHIALIDAVHKKTAFLTQVKAELDLTNVSVHTGRVQQFRVDTPFDIITSRAFAELSDFIECSKHLLGANGRFLAMKGMLPEEEIRRLPRGWAIRDVMRLRVPGLDAFRHLLTIQRESAGSMPQC
ncbi:MAG: 16S rRNA (guanine(527)-N(7))-methyltransferase RsmG [Burkholderiaceae bacterium]